MPVPVAPNANRQIAALQKLIASDKADGKVTAKESQQILAQAKKEYVQGGELAQLRTLAGDKKLDPAARDAFVRAVDQIVPAGAPTAQVAAILFRVDPNTGRKQLLSLLDNAKNPVRGGPKTFVVTGLGPPYLAAITTAQMTTGLVKFLDGATPKDATKIRHYLGEQLRTFELPISRGGLSVTSLLPPPKGIALSVDTRAGGAIAVNQHAVVLKALEKVTQLEGPANAPVAAKGKKIADRLARELKAELDFCYPAKGRLAYSLVMQRGKPVTGFLEDGNHLKTTLDALKALKVYGKQFAPVVDRIVKRLPEMAFAGPEDLGSAHGQLYTPEFNNFLAAAARIEKKTVVTAKDVASLEALSRHDGLLSPGEKGVLARVKKRVK